MAPIAHGQRSGRISELDGLRGIAVLLVLWAHLPLLSGHWLGAAFHGIAGFLMAGHLGVDLFFALSGYLITRQLLQLRASGGPDAFRSFQVRRALRIFPLFYLVLIATMWLLPGYGYLKPAVYLANYGFAADLGPHPLRHTWSLAVEEQFYLFWPLLVLYAPQSSLPWIVGRLIPGAAVLASVAIIALVPQPLASALVERGLESRMLTIALGASLAFAPLASAPRGGRWWIAAILLLASHALVRLVPAGSATLIRHLGSAGISVLVLDAVIRTDARGAGRRLRGMLSARPLTGIGVISYGIYLIHFPIFYGCFRQADILGEFVPLPVVLAAVAAAIALAWAAHLLVERPCFRLQRVLALGKAGTLPEDMNGPPIPLIGPSPGRTAGAA